MEISNGMQNEIRQAITAALQSLDLPEVDFVVEHPADMSHGDYATNVALVAAKKAGKNPRELAEEIAAQLSDFNTEIAGPGFINFTLKRDFFSEKITQALEQGEAWGRNETWLGKNVLVEYTDPNPFKEFHVGHLFTNTVGESIARLFMMAGADTKRCNYQGDVGMHVAHAIWGMQQMGLTPESSFTARDLGAAYAKGATAYKEDETAAAEIKTINKAVYERSNETINSLYDYGRQLSLDYFETVYRMLGTDFDHYFFESEAGPKGKQLVLDNPDTFTDSEGAKVFVGEEYGLHTRVFLNSEGLPTYEAKELALCKMKEAAAGVYDHSVISTANEITEYFKVLLKAMSFVYPELAAKTEHIGHGTVRLTSGKMSSRTGQVISAIDFIDEIKETAHERMVAAGKVDDDRVAEQVAIGAIKYATLQGNILQDSVFDNEKALSFEGNSGPYLQYTYARINSVLEKAAAAGVTSVSENAPENPYIVERLIYQFPEIIEEALVERAPHKVVHYLTELAGAFNTFYANEKIADDSDEYAPYKAAVAAAVQQTLKNGLWVLGIEAPEQM